MTPIFDEDYQIALTPFQRLRSVQTANVYLPEDMVYDSNFLHNMETLLAERGAFRTWPNAKDPCNDKELQQAQDEMFLNLDLKLEMLPGITANMMRLERFRSRYSNGVGSESRYEKELEKILRTRTTYCDNCNRPKNIQLRFMAMWAFNPRSVFHRFFRSDPSWDLATRLSPSISFKPVSKVVERGRFKEELEWNQDNWHSGCYPRGIPPFDSDQFLKNMWKGGLWQRCVSDILERVEREAERVDGP